MLRRPIAATILPAALLCGAALAPAVALAAPVDLKATLTGAAETPPGDPDGVGGFTVSVDPATNDFCYTLWGDNIAAPTMAHVHSGAAGVSGPPVITLDVTGKDDNVCLAVDKAKLDPIVANPSAYYINIHNAEFPAGALRGQLTK